MLMKWSSIRKAAGQRLQASTVPHGVVLRLEVLAVYYFSFLSVTVLVLQERVSVSWISD